MKMPGHKLPPVKWNIIFLAIALVVVVVDQLTKWWIQSNFYLGQSVPETGFFRLVYVQNTGAAFSIFYGHVGILTVVSIIGAIIILTYNFVISRRLPYLETRMNKIALGLILGGTLGNLIDRIWLGYVRDFVSVGIWPIFNVADSATDVGVFIFALSVILAAREPRKPKA
jgi:signal peptidase II